MLNYSDFGLVITDNVKLKLFAEHKGYYYVYFENIPKELMYFKFAQKWRMERFLYGAGVEHFTYKSSNGKLIPKKWEYIQEELDGWRTDRFRTKKEKERGYPEKYSSDDWYCGHYVKGE